MKNVVCIPW